MRCTIGLQLLRIRSAYPRASTLRAHEFDMMPGRPSGCSVFAAIMAAILSAFFFAARIVSLFIVCICSCLSVCPNGAAVV